MLDRAQFAASAPPLVRKVVRMVEHYGRRAKEWSQVVRQMRGVTPLDQLVLWASLCVGPLTALQRLDGFEPPVLLRDATVDVAGVGRFRVRAGTDDIIHVLPAREPMVKAELERLLRPGDTFIDAGANIGFYSVIAARLVGDGGRVLAFEMMPDTAETLRTNIGLNAAGQVTILERALSDRSEQTLTALSGAVKRGQASIVASTDAHPRSTTVKTITLDDALAGVGQIRLMKMDLEGAELMALAGAGRMIQRTKAVIFENNDRDLQDRRVLGMLEEAGFAVTLLDTPDYVAVRPDIAA